MNLVMFRQKTNEKADAFKKAQMFIEKNRQRIQKRINFCVQHSPYDFADFMSEALIVVVDYIYILDSTEKVINNIFRKFAKMTDIATICGIDNINESKIVKIGYRDNLYLINKAVKKIAYSKARTIYDTALEINLDFIKKKNKKLLKSAIALKYKKFSPISQSNFNYLFVPSKRIIKKN